MSLAANLLKHTSPGRAVYVLSPSCPAFCGHFPGRPLLPAVAQVSLCTHALNTQSSVPLTLVQIKRAKFLRPLLPGAHVAVTWSQKAPGTFAFALSDLEGTCYSRLELIYKECV